MAWRASMACKLESGPFTASAYEDCFGTNCVNLFLTWAQTDLPENYRDQTGQNFWRTVEKVATEAGGCCYFHRTEDGETFLHVQIAQEELRGKFDFLLETSTVPTLYRIVDRHMVSEQFKIAAWIHYAVKFGRAEAERLLELVNTWSQTA